jgi:hypothetical protein
MDYKLDKRVIRNLVPFRARLLKKLPKLTDRELFEWANYIRTQKPGPLEKDALIFYNIIIEMEHRGHNRQNIFKRLKARKSSSHTFARSGGGHTTSFVENFAATVGTSLTPTKRSEAKGKGGQKKKKSNSSSSRGGGSGSSCSSCSPWWGGGWMNPSPPSMAHSSSSTSSHHMAHHVKETMQEAQARLHHIWESRRHAAASKTRSIQESCSQLAAHYEHAKRYHMID